MTKQNRFSKNFSKKSTAELKNIVDNPKFQSDAQMAASWELEKRNNIGLLNEENETKIDRIVFTTEKKENRLILLLIFSLIALMARCSQGISTKSISSYESIFNLVGLIFSTGLIVYMVRNSFEKMSEINESFEISDNDFVFKKGEDVIVFNNDNRPHLIERSLNQITISQGDFKTKIDLEKYTLSYSRSKLLTQKIEELNKNWLNQAT